MFSAGGPWESGTTSDPAPRTSCGSRKPSAPLLEGMSEYVRAVVVLLDENEVFSLVVSVPKQRFARFLPL